MVRLKVLFTGGIASGIAAFQFQNGTIKRKMASQMGACEINFNSKMVRLKVPKSPVTVMVPKFQFQNGTIKSSFSFFESWGYSLISIPKWYD